MNRKSEEVRENRRIELLEGSMKSNYGPGRRQESDREKSFYRRVCVHVKMEKGRIERRQRDICQKELKPR